jgi:hypothetical protein
MGLVRPDLTSAALLRSAETHRRTGLKTDEGPVQLSRAAPAVFSVRYRLRPDVKASSGCPGH